MEEMSIKQLYILIKDKGVCTTTLQKEISGCQQCVLVKRCEEYNYDTAGHTLDDFFKRVYTDSKLLIDIFLAKGLITESDVFEGLL